MTKTTHTWQEILSQPGVWRATLESFDAGRPALRAFLDRATFDQIVVVGCGSTHYLSQAAAPVLTHRAGIRAYALPSSELWLYPGRVPAGRTLLVAVSRSGVTTETLLAFERFLARLQACLQAAGLAHTWPCFIVAKLGTDLHTTNFDRETARQLTDRVAPFGSLVKGHYSDWVENPADYPATGMGGANVGPELTATDLVALRELCDREIHLAKRYPSLSLSRFEESLKTAVVESNRWQRWLTSGEEGCGFDELTRSRQEWLVATGARYVWTHPRVLGARKQLADNLRSELPDLNAFVVDRIAQKIQDHVDALKLKDSLPRLVG